MNINLNWKRFVLENIVFFMLCYRLPLVIQIVLAIVFSLAIEAVLQMRERRAMLNKLNKRFELNKDQKGA